MLRKLKTLSKNKKILLSALICSLFIVILCFSCCKIISKKVSNSNKLTIVIDAGHGGRDGGCVGVNGTVEKEINLEYAKTLKKYFESANINVIMTRQNDNGLYSENAGNKKISDMKSRAKIIMNSKPDLTISIHMNSFPLKSASGARVYHQIKNEKSKKVADIVQKSLSYYCGAKHKLSSGGDYYILNCSTYTSILVECGYLSNSEEEQRLNTTEYRENLMFSVFCGVQLYLGYNYYSS